MAASLTASVVDGCPGNSVVLNGSGLTPGSNAGVVLQNQGLVTPANLTLAAVFDSSGNFVTVTIPDGVTTNTLVVTANDLTSATCELVVGSQYLQSSQYTIDGEGTDAAIAALPTGTLDNILRDASSYIDDVVGTTLRYLQVQEDLPFRPSRRIYPLRSPRKKIPLVSLDDLKFITSNAITTEFNVGGTAPDVYVSKTTGYFEVQTYAVGNAILLGAIQTIGFSANRWLATYTAGYPWAQTPREIRKATAIIATELLIYRGIILSGLGGLESIRQGTQQYNRRSEAFAIPQPALDLLRPYRAGSFG